MGDRAFARGCTEALVIYVSLYSRNPVHLVTVRAFF